MSNPANETQTFNILDVLSVSTGILMLKMDGIYRVMDWLMDTSHSTLGLVANHDRCIKELLRQHPWLREVEAYINEKMEAFPPKHITAQGEETGPRQSRAIDKEWNPAWDEAWEALKVDILAKWPNDIPLYHAPMDDRVLPPHDLDIIKKYRPDIADEQIVIITTDEDGEEFNIGRITPAGR